MTVVTTRSWKPIRQHTMKALQTRGMLRWHPDVGAALEAWWAAMRRSTGGADSVSEGAYVRLSKRLYGALNEEYDEDDAEATARDEWAEEMEKHGQPGALSPPMLKSALFEVADLFTEEIDAAEYAAFLWGLLERLDVGPGAPDQRRLWDPPPPTPPPAAARPARGRQREPQARSAPALVERPTAATAPKRTLRAVASEVDLKAKTVARLVPPRPELALPKAAFTPFGAAGDGASGRPATAPAPRDESANSGAAGIETSDGQGSGDPWAETLASTRAAMRLLALKGRPSTAAATVCGATTATAMANTNGSDGRLAPATDGMDGKLWSRRSSSTMSVASSVSTGTDSAPSSRAASDKPLTASWGSLYALNHRTGWGPTRRQLTMEEIARARLGAPAHPRRLPSIATGLTRPASTAVLRAWG
jgi:hypothetical protein